jgi:anaerobic magnesium-protoporphyrin IX monomethyl ester cyclase
LGINNLFKKFKQHFISAGLFYAFWRGIKYIKFILSRQKNIKQDCFIESGALRIYLSDGGIQIFWSNKRLTLSSGLNVAINTLGLWADSSKAKWELLEKNLNSLKVRISFDNLPLIQVWKINICDKGHFVWEIQSQNTEWLHVDELRIVSLLNSDYTYWFCGYEQKAFYRFQKDWVDFKVNAQPYLLAGVRFPKEGTGLPAFSLETDHHQAKVLIQNSSYHENLRVIGFSITYPQDQCDLVADSLQSFKINLHIFETDVDLDSKIEFLRQDVVRTVFKENKLPYVHKRLKILLVNLPWYKNGVWGVRAGSRWPHTKDLTEGQYMPFPFFLAQATSLLQKNLIQAEIIDAIAEQLTEDTFMYRLLSKKIDYLVAETSIPSFFQDMEILSRIAKHNIKIILCGPNSLIYQPAFMRQYPFIDFVLKGEYELALLDLIKALEDNSDLSLVAGMLYRKNEEFLSTAERKLCVLDSLPWPHRDSLPMDKYWDLPGDIPSPSVQMLASRGCPFNCNFCLWPQVMYKSNAYRFRDIEDVINEMEHLVKNMGFKSVYFDDDTFNIGKERMLEFCNKLQARGLSNIPWAIMARADTMDEQILLAMKKSGLAAVKYGVETFNPEFISSCQKGLDISKAEKMIRFTKDLGIKVHLTFTFGFSGETKKTIKKTIERGLKLDPDSVQFSILTPFPGTKLFEQLDSGGKILTYDWARYDGNSQCVFKSEGIKPEELLAARKYAYLLWGDYQRKKRGFLGDLNRFNNLLKFRGLGFALKKFFTYLGFLVVKKIAYFNGKY